MRFLTVLLCVTFTLKAIAWSPYTHSRMVEEIFRDVAREWGLDRPVRITPFEEFLKKLAQEKPEIRTREDFARWLQINPRARFDQPYPDETIGTDTTPLKILIAYAPKSDDGRDMKLSYDPVEQFWFGRGTATVSQAFRHMEKPPFNLRRPLDTFGFPLGTVGQASRRAQIYFDLSLTASKLGEPYWAWNFLGCGLHYLQDLQNPYHSAQLLPPIPVKGLVAYWKWGRKQGQDIIHALTHLTSNLHHYFEGYVEWMLKSPSPSDPVMIHQASWVEALHGKEILKKGKRMPAIQNLAKKIRDFSNRSSFEAIQATLELSGGSLLTHEDYSIGTNEAAFPANPVPYLNTDAARRKEGAEAVGRIIRSNFGYQGKALRAAVREFLDQQ